MPDYSNLVRSIPNVGKVWENGRYIKCPFLSPHLAAISNNIKRLIYQEQVAIFTEQEALSGLVFKKDNLVYFNEDSIHIAVRRDPNRLAIWIDIEEEETDGTDKPRKVASVTVYATPGKGDFEKQIEKATAYLQGVSNLFHAMPPEELIHGWPANISANKKLYQPEIKILGNRVSKPDAGQGELADTVPPIPILNLKIQIIPKHNILQS